MASGRTNKNRRRLRAAPMRSDRDSGPFPDFSKEGRVAHEAGFGEVGNLLALAGAVAGNSSVLAYALRIREEHKRRFAEQTPELLTPFGRRLLTLIPPADAALTALGAEWSYLDSEGSGDPWADGLRGGLDDAVTVLLKLREGLTVAAVVGARAFIERWTFNVASTHSVPPRETGETDADYITRVWERYDLAKLGRDPGRDWALLSDLLHGREITLGSRQVALDAGGIGLFALHAEIARMLDVPLLQVRGGIREHVMSIGRIEFDGALGTRASDWRGSWTEPPGFRKALGPAEFVTLGRPNTAAILADAANYRDHTAHSIPGEVIRNVTGDDALGALTERLARRLENAQLSYRVERELVGDAFDYGFLAAKLFRYLAIAAMGEALAREAPTFEARALRIASAALTAAWNYWVEDNDLSMPSVRVLVEQTAIARSFRLKPEKATKLTARTGLPAARWFELAGWGRLSVFVRALGEFSHIRPNMRREGARGTLEGLLEIDPEWAKYGARREALDEAAYMLGHEVARRLDDLDASLASAFRDGVTLLEAEEHEARLEQWLERTLRHKAADFGSPDMQASE